VVIEEQGSSSSSSNDSSSESVTPGTPQSVSSPGACSSRGRGTLESCPSNPRTPQQSQTHNPWDSNAGFDSGCVYKSASGLSHESAPRYSQRLDAGFSNSAASSCIRVGGRLSPLAGATAVANAEAERCPTLPGHGARGVTIPDVRPPEQQQQQWLYKRLHVRGRQSEGGTGSGRRGDAGGAAAAQLGGLWSKASAWGVGMTGCMQLQRTLSRD
jgi:hypothetical protein